MSFPKSFVFKLLCSICICIFAVSCGVKNDPIAPKRIIIPMVSDVKATLSNNNVRLSWTPSLRYSDGKALELRTVEVWRLDETLEERMMEMQERQQRQDEERAKAGLDITPDPNLKAMGTLAERLVELGKLNPERFERNGKIVGTLPIEQLIDMSFNGRVYWSESRPGTATDLPTVRSVYAIREVDANGRKSMFSNMVAIYPVEIPPAPEALSHSVSQTQLALLWASPARPENTRGMALLGYNVYVAAGQAGFSPSPVNAEPIASASPLDWTPYLLLSTQRIDGTNSQHALLMHTTAEAKPAGIMQTIYAPDVISEHIGEEVTVTISMRSTTGSGLGHVVLDASRDPSIETSIPVGQDIFRQEADNPLIQVEKIELGSELKTYTITGKVPVGAVAYFLRIEPRGASPVSVSSIVESVSVTRAGSTEELITNGDFSQFSPLTYAETIETFGRTKQFRVTALYKIGSMTIESAPVETEEILIADTFAPDAPRSVRAQATFDSITITWNRARATDVEGYNVYRQEPGNPRWRKLTNRPVSGTLYRDTEVEAGKTYNYRVEAVDNAGNASSSDDVVSAKVLTQN